MFLKLLLLFIYLFLQMLLFFENFVFGDFVEMLDVFWMFWKFGKCWMFFGCFGFLGKLLEFVARACGVAPMISALW